jgi:two-component system, OmpR family, response regulator
VSRILVMTPLHAPPSRLSILVADDDADTAQSQAELLTLHGHAARCVGTGPDMGREATASPPDVILLDLRTPGLDGWEMARRLRAVCPAVVVAVSSCAGREDLRRSREVGIVDQIIKPVDPARLLAVFRRIGPSGRPGQS